MYSLINIKQDFYILGLYILLIVLFFFCLAFALLSLFIFGDQVIYWFYTADWIPFPTAYLFLDAWELIKGTLPDDVNIDLKYLYENKNLNKDEIVFIKYWAHPLFHFCSLKEYLGFDSIGNWLLNKPDLTYEGLGVIIWKFKIIIVSILNFLPLAIIFFILFLFSLISYFICDVILAHISHLKRNYPDYNSA
jgi:hypothetical protein